MDNKSIDAEHIHRIQAKINWKSALVPSALKKLHAKVQADWWEDPIDFPIRKDIAIEYVTLAERFIRIMVERHYDPAEIEVHPDETDGFFPDNATALIIGTFPPKNFVNVNPFFYYPNPRNEFWNLVGQVYETRLTSDNLDEAFTLRRAFCEAKGFAVTDMILHCVRIDPSDFSDDTNLCVIKRRDIHWILCQHPTVNTVYFTSGKNYGAEGLFTKEMNSQVPPIWMSTPNQKEKKIRSVKVNGRTITTYPLYSPSNRTSRAGIRIANKLEQYKSYFAKVIK